MVSRERPRARALRLLRSGIKENTFATGQPLPPERELAAQFEVSRNTLRWALERLTEDGLIRSGGFRTRLVAETDFSLQPSAQAVYLYSSVDSGALSAGLAPGWGAMLVAGVLQGLHRSGRVAVLPGRLLPDETDLASFLRQAPAGVMLTDSMFYPGTSPAILKRIEDALAGGRIPVVLFGEAPTTFDRIISDHEAGGHALVQWLISRGSRRLLCPWHLDDGQAGWKTLRLAGYERALREAGLPPLVMEPVPWSGDSTNEEGFREQVIRVAGHLVPHLRGDQPIDTVLAMSDGNVPVISAALRRCGREPNKDITVAGYDNYWTDIIERRYCPDPPVATVDKSNLDLGLAMAQMLDDRIAGRLPAEPQLRSIMPRVVPMGF